MGRKNKNLFINKDVLINRLLKENSRLVHESIKLQDEIRALNKKNMKLNKFIHKMMKCNKEEIFVIKNNNIQQY